MVAVSAPRESVHTFTLIHGQILATAQFWRNLTIAQSIIARDGTELDVGSLDFHDADLLPEFGAIIDPRSFGNREFLGKGAFGSVYRSTMRVWLCASKHDARWR